MSDDWDIVCIFNCNNIKSTVCIVQIVFKQISFCNFPELAALRLSDGFFGFAIEFGAPRFHFYEHKEIVVFSHNVDFTALVPKITFEDTITFFL